MGRVSGMMHTKGLRQRLLFGLGAALFAVGAVILSIGLVGYFDQREGDSVSSVVSERPSAQNLGHMPAVPYDPSPTVTEPTPKPVAVPLRMVVESLGVDAPVVEMGLDAQGIPQVPFNGQDVAWYNFSSPPGAGSNAVFAGHINWEGASGVFGNLGELQPGDTVRLMSEGRFAEGDGPHTYGHRYPHHVRRYLDTGSQRAVRGQLHQPHDSAGAADGVHARCARCDRRRLVRYQTRDGEGPAAAPRGL